MKNAKEAFVHLRLAYNTYVTEFTNVSDKVIRSIARF